MLLESGMAMGLAGTRGSVVSGVVLALGVDLSPVADAIAQAMARTATVMPTAATTRRRRKSAAEGISPSCQENFQPFHARPDDRMTGGAATAQPPADLAGPGQDG